MSQNLFTKCPKCGNNIEPNAKECDSCGIKLNSSFGEDSDSYIRLMGEIAVKNNMISKQDFDVALSEYTAVKESQFPEKIEDILLRKKIISPERLSKLIAATLRAMDKLFCTLAMEKKWISKGQALKVLEFQNKLYQKKILKSVADILKEHEFLTPQQISNLFSELKLPSDNKTGSEYKSLKQIWEEDDKKQEKQETILQPVAHKYLKIAKMAVEYGYLSQQQVNTALQKWSAQKKEEDSETEFLNFILKNQVINQKQAYLLNLNYEYDKLKELDITFCKLAILYKFIDEQKAEEALKIQKAIFKEKLKLMPVPNVLKQKQFLTDLQIYRILREQKRNELAVKFYDEVSLTKTELEQKDFSPPLSPDDIAAAQKSPEDIKLIISEDNMKAVLFPVNANATLQAVKAAIRDKGVIYGIVKDSVIEKFIQTKSDTPIIVAKGIPTVHPINAEIKCHFTENYLNVGSIDEEGNIDFMDRGEVPTIQEEILLAEKLPMKPGINGMDIFGNELLVAAPSDVKLQVGPGTRFDESETKVYSTQSGKPHISMDGKISVCNVHEIKGDVDFKTGHIDFKGNIIITGSIKPGFKVTGHDISVGEVNDGIIEAEGYVEVKNGIYGGKIFSERGLSAKFINKSTITSFGDIKVEKGIMESDIKTSGIITASSGKIISSVVAAKGGVEAKQIGTDVSDAATIDIGSIAYLESILKPHQESLQKIETIIQNLDEKRKTHIQKLKTIQQDIAENAQTQDKANRALNKLKQNLQIVAMSRNKNIVNELKTQITSLEQRVAENESIMENFFSQEDATQELIHSLNAELEEYNKQKEEVLEQIDAIKKFDESFEPSPVLIVHGSLEKGTKVTGPNSVWKVHETMTKIRAREVKAKDPEGNSIFVIKVDRAK